MLFCNLPEPNDVVEAEQSTGGGWFFSVADWDRYSTKSIGVRFAKGCQEKKSTAVLQDAALEALCSVRSDADGVSGHKKDANSIIRFGQNSYPM